MYFPYLYARQSELLALEQMARDHRSFANFLPIIEPVVPLNSQFKRVLKTYGDDEYRLGVVVNPDKHELSNAAALAKWREDAYPEIIKNHSVIPVVRCFPGVSYALVESVLGNFRGRDVAVAYSSPTLEDSEIAKLALLSNVKFHIILDRRIGSHTVAKLPTAKIVDLRDNFNKLDRNADYRDPEFFTDLHRTFGGTGIAGFGDYCTIGSDLSVSGGPAAAVAIHAVFKKQSVGDIWVEHFVSDDTDRFVGDTASKFIQAARKLVAAAAGRPNEFGENFALDEFQNYVDRNHFPNLAKSKELQICHHICLMLDVLDGRV